MSPQTFRLVCYVCSQAASHIHQYDGGDSCFYLCHEHANDEGVRAAFARMPKRSARHDCDDPDAEPGDDYLIGVQYDRPAEYRDAMASARLLK